MGCGFANTEGTKSQNETVYDREATSMGNTERTSRGSLSFPNEKRKGIG